MNIKAKIRSYIEIALKNLSIDNAFFALEYPENPEHGDFSTNVAMVNAKSLNTNPKDLANKIILEIKKDEIDFIKDIKLAGPGFINFSIKDDFFIKKILSAEIQDNKYGWGNNGSDEQVLVEYTDPNTFKVFHIGHLMSNAIGESISRLVQGSGSNVVRLCYPSDIGLHIAKSIWAMKKNLNDIPIASSSIQEKTNFLGKMYVQGVQAYVDSIIKIEIDSINKVLYDKSDSEINELYLKGRQWSIEHFELLYKRLDTKFDDYIYESEMAPIGLDIVKHFLKKGVFEISEGATVFKGENYGLHTRVFINSQGLPTYEAKEMGLNVSKFKKYPDTSESVIITASEQNDYFRVVVKALSLIDQNIGSKTKHIGHGMLRFTSGKMSSRSGKVITAETLISEIKSLVIEKLSQREIDDKEIDEIADTVAIGAIKYTILRQSIGSDVIFDSAASISFEGDSGPYLQYSAVRANSIIEKAKNQGISELIVPPENVSLLEKLIIRFPDIIERARAEYSPQQVSNYLISLAGAFNAYYSQNTIIDKDDPQSPYRVALTKAFHITITNGLWLLGIKVPRLM